ncbi:hypothetical protein M514_24003 [Trichuris suis]|uniref:Uncharacterized protein n=1 Tax=Trichuris suis TaxID=68888 RepID=A0A085M5Z5_9BILA|nr:hypothetical protein M513_06488 [Trichuris suis]KFD60427.1 hypothetical protein M514_06488 [Trichuris suis]KFD63855.1 hypothetical protein M514_24003 [Trichuris suis]
MRTSIFEETEEALDPFSVVGKAGLQLQEELLELQAIEELKSKFKLRYFMAAARHPMLMPSL